MIVNQITRYALRLWPAFVTWYGYLLLLSFESLRASYGSVTWTFSLPLLAILVGLVILEDPVRGSDPSWLTLPVSGAQVMAAKVATVGLFLVLPALAAQALESYDAGLSPAGIGRSTFSAALFAVTVATAAAGLASLCATFKGFLLSSCGAVFGFTASLQASGWVFHRVPILRDPLKGRTYPNGLELPALSPDLAGLAILLLAVSLAFGAFALLHLKRRAAAGLVLVLTSLFVLLPGRSIGAAFFAERRVAPTDAAVSNWNWSLEPAGGDLKGFPANFLADNVPVPARLKVSPEASHLEHRLSQWFVTLTYPDGTSTRQSPRGKAHSATVDLDDFAWFVPDGGEIEMRFTNLLHFSKEEYAARAEEPAKLVLHSGTSLGQRSDYHLPARAGSRTSDEVVSWKVDRFDWKDGRLTIAVTGRELRPYSWITRSLATPQDGVWRWANVELINRELEQVADLEVARGKTGPMFVTGKDGQVVNLGKRSPERYLFAPILLPYPLAHGYRIELTGTHVGRAVPSGIRSQAGPITDKWLEGAEIAITRRRELPPIRTEIVIEDFVAKEWVDSAQGAAAAEGAS